MTATQQHFERQKWREAAVRESPPPQGTLKYTAICPDEDESHWLALGLLGGARRVLEVGAATGYVSEAIASMGSTVAAVEVDDRSASIARQRGLDVRTGTVDTVVRPDELFDCVVLLDVIEHVADADRFLDSCLEHLTSDGCVILSVPNIAHWTVRWSLLRGRFEYTSTGLLDETHLHFYTAASLERLLHEHGCRIVERRQALGLYAYAKSTNREWLWQRRKLVRRAASRWPELFAFQFVWKAVRATGPEHA